MCPAWLAGLTAPIGQGVVPAVLASMVVPARVWRPYVPSVLWCNAPPDTAVSSKKSSACSCLPSRSQVSAAYLFSPGVVEWADHASSAAQQELEPPLGASSATALPASGQGADAQDARESGQGEDGL